ncbi:MAG: LptF/LptG family permease [Bacteroidota bacterium]
MLPIIDRYILSRFLYNFFSSFAILMVIFIFQTVWLFIDDLAGKDLDIWIIGKFLLYYMPTLIDKVLPLTVLLASLLTFGSFAENYEFAAMKASGVSLQKAMRSIVSFVLLLGVGAFFLANNVIPASEQKIYNMRRNIAKVKPAAVIVEGVFSDIEGTDMNMKVARKSGDKDQYLEDVIIHQKAENNLNTTVIRAETGELISSETSDIIQLVLNDGYYYEEMQRSKPKDRRKHPFTRSEFATYIKNIEVSDLNSQDIEAESDITTDKMKNVVRLTKDIDSLYDNNIKQIKAFSKNIAIRMGAFPIKEVDSAQVAKIKKNKRPVPVEKEESVIDKDNLITLVPEWQQSQVYTNAKNAIVNIVKSIDGKKEEMDKRFEIYNRHILSLHKKFALAFACIILFFVGAPLGAIIRKGGLGLPMVIAIVLFLVYYFIGVFAENSAKKGGINPVLGAWLSTMIMFPLGVYLTKRATADRGLMGDGNLFQYLKGYFKTKKKKGS